MTKILKGSGIGEIDEGRAYIRRWCEEYIALLREMLKSAWPAIKKDFPQHSPPCHSCAFNPGTDSWRGFEKTVTGLMFAIEDAKPFFCHEGHPRTEDGWLLDPAKAQLCAGYAAVANEPNLKAVALKASRKAGRLPRSVTWDENRGLTFAKEDDDA